METMKKCYICKQSKSLSDFYKKCGTKDGFRYECKSCTVISTRKYQKTKKGKITLRRYQQSEKGKAKYRRYNALHPKRRRAKDAVKYAIKIGKVSSVKTLQCCYCGKQARQYHHYKSYAKKHRLDIIPVCRKCHRKLHKKVA